MVTIGINLDLSENPWRDLRDRPDLIHVDTPIRVGALPGGMASGKASVSITAFLPDGRPVLIETSMECFLAAAAVLRARYVDNVPRGKDA